MEQCFGITSDCNCEECNALRRQYQSDDERQKRFNTPLFSIPQMEAMGREELSGVLVGLWGADLQRIAKSLNISQWGKKSQVTKRILDHLFPQESHE